MLSNSKYLGGISSFDDYFSVQVEKEKCSNVNEDSKKRKAIQHHSKDVLGSLLICEECGAIYWRVVTRPSGEAAAPTK